MSKDWKNQQQQPVSVAKTTPTEKFLPFEEWAKDVMCAMIIAKSTSTGDEALVNKAISTTEALCSKLKSRELDAGSED